MAQSEQQKFYWRWQYRVIPALVTVPLAILFGFAAVVLPVNVVSSVIEEGWTGELILGGIVGVAVNVLLFVGFSMWSIAALRAGRFTIGDSELLLPKLPLSPFAFFPHKVLLSRIIDVDFDENSLQDNKPPVVKFAIRMAKPIQLPLARYPYPDLVGDFLKTHLSHLEPEKGE